MSNEIYDSNIQTLQISTGNVATVNDPFIASSLGQGQFGSPFGARNPVGMAAYVSDGTLTNPQTGTGRRWKVRYVRMNATTFAGPLVGPVYWKDNTFQVVTTLSTEAPAGLNGCAGFLLNVNVTNGNYCFILVNGFIGVANLGAVAIGTGGIAAGGLVYAAAGQQLTSAVAPAGTRGTTSEIGTLMTAVAAGVADVLVGVET